MTDWRDLVMARAEEELDAKRSSRPPKRDHHIRLSLYAASLIYRSARERRMSVARYVQSAAIAFASFDMGVDTYEALAEEPIQRPGRGEDGYLLAEGTGKWKIEDLK